jgi:hypothetical protein
MHAPVHARCRHERDHPDCKQPGDDANRPIPEVGGDQQREPAVHGDRCGRVPGWIARIDRQAFEAVNARAVRVHDERGRTVGRRLDGQREDEERDQRPLAKESGHERQNARDDRQHDAARDDRADERSVGPGRRAMGR